MKRMRILSALLAVALLGCLVLGGCASSGEGNSAQPADNADSQPSPPADGGTPAPTGDKDPGDVTIGFLFCGFNTPSVAAAVSASKEVANRLGFNLVQMDGEFSAQTQADQALQLISMEVDVIIANVAFTDAFTEVARQINEAGIPLMTWCQTLSPETDEWVTSFVGVDDTSCGPWAMDVIKNTFADRDSVNVVEIRGALGSLCYNNRHNGFQEAMTAEGDANIVNLLETQVSDNVNAEEGQAIMENYLNKYPDIDVVYCVDDAVAAGAALAIENAGLKGEIMVIGINGEPRAFEFIKGGHNYVTLKQHIEWGAVTVTENAFAYAMGEPVEWIIDEWEVVDASNVNDTEPAWPE